MIETLLLQVAKKPTLIDPQLFQIILLIISGLVSVIGIFLTMSINGLKETLKEHNQELKDHRQMIDNNSAQIKLNTEKDILNQQFLKETIERLEAAITTGISEMKGEIKDLTSKFNNQNTD